MKLGIPVYAGNDRFEGTLVAEHETTCTVQVHIFGAMRIFPKRLVICRRRPPNQSRKEPTKMLSAQIISPSMSLPHLTPAPLWPPHADCNGSGCPGCHGKGRVSSGPGPFRSMTFALPRGKPLELFLQELLDVRVNLGSVEFSIKGKFVEAINVEFGTAPVDLGDVFRTVLSDGVHVVTVTAEVVAELGEGVWALELGDEGWEVQS